MKISSVRKEESGTYYCIAYNGVGDGDKRKMNLEVEFVPVVSAPISRKYSNENSIVIFNSIKSQEGF